MKRSGFRTNIIVIIMIIFVTVILTSTYKKALDSKLRDMYIREFDNYYIEEIIAEKTENEIIIYINEQPVYLKDVLLYNGVAKLEHEHYNGKKDETLTYSVVAVIMDTFYIDLVDNKFNKTDSEYVLGLEKIKKQLKVQKESKSPIVSATSEIRLNYAKDFNLWYKGRHSFTILEQKISKENSKANQNNIGELILNDLKDDSGNYNIRFTNKMPLEITINNVLAQLEEFEFTYDEDR